MFSFFSFFFLQILSRNATDLPRKKGKQRKLEQLEIVINSRRAQFEVYTLSHRRVERGDIERGRIKGKRMMKEGGKGMQSEMLIFITD